MKMMSQETRDRIDEAEQEWFDRRLEELSGQIMNRAKLYARVQRELDDIRAHRNDD